LLSIFDAFVGDVLVKAVSHRRAESPCQALSVPLSEIANIRTTPTNGSKTLVKYLRYFCEKLLLLEIPQQKGQRPLSTVFDCFVGFCLN